MTGWAVPLLAATAVHAGFQLTVTGVVYPALAGTAPEQWAEVHARHSGSITPVVGLVYGGTLVACAGAVASAPAARPVWVAVLGTVGAITVTAVRAAPLHGRLGRAGPQPALLRALRRADHLRTALAAVALAGAGAYGSGFG